MVQMLSEAAEELRQPYSYGAMAETYDDLPGIQRGWPPVMGASVEIPRRYSHSAFEVVNLKTVEYTAKMVAVAVEKLSLGQ
jgi:putative aminopeptidase FrvX